PERVRGFESLPLRSVLIEPADAQGCAGRTIAGRGHEPFRSTDGLPPVAARGAVMSLAFVRVPGRSRRLRCVAATALGALALAVALTGCGEDPAPAAGTTTIEAGGIAFNAVVREPSGDG